MTTLTVDIPDALIEQLQALAREQQRPVDELAVEAVRQYVAVEELRSLRRRLVPYAKAQGYLTDEDVFRDVS